MLYIHVVKIFFPSIPSSLCNIKSAAESFQNFHPPKLG